ncbi:MAG: DUF5053 domain-containing protein [Prevotella sp.]|jgi:hypothetical protein|nr:DUF5053 domain-containing protein [Prevotella sp.]
MNLQEELKVLDQYAGTDTDKFLEHLRILLDKYESQNDKDIIIKYSENALDKIREDISIFIEETGMFIKELDIKMQLLEVSKIVSLSYIAKKYFKKTRGWLYQKINGNTKNGKPVKFTPEEVETLNHALQDISKQLGSTVISL